MGKGAGRPRKWDTIDKDQLINLAERQWTTESIAAHFKVGKDLILRHFATELQDGRHSGKAKLLDELWARAFGQRQNKKSDRILEHLANRVLGPITQKVEFPDGYGHPQTITPTPAQIIIQLPPKDDSN